MIKCRCGKWSNYGLTCASCRVSVSVVETDDGEGDVEEVTPDEEELDLEEESDQQ